MKETKPRYRIHFSGKGTPFFRAQNIAALNSVDNDKGWREMWRRLSEEWINELQEMKQL